jgi:rfaE bifunctional protein kinase chain/domain
VTDRLELPDFTSLRVVIVGDLIADRYVFAEPKSVSREAPIMVLRHRTERLGAGGAANVARNALALGASVSILGAVGRDRQGRELTRILEEEGADVSGIASLEGWDTPTKTRIFAAEARRNARQVLRLDRDPITQPPSEWRAGLARRLLDLASEVDVVLISDYAYGVVGAEVGAVALEVAANTTIVLDPRDSLTHFCARKHGRNACGLSAATPNQGELAAFAGVAHRSLDDDAALVDAALRVREELGCAHLLVTRGNRGMALFSTEGEGLFVPASGEGEATDVCGAGDTAAAVFALTLAAGGSASDAMVLANAAGGQVVMENGAVVCTPSTLARALTSAPMPIGALAAGAGSKNGGQGEFVVARAREG